MSEKKHILAMAGMVLSVSLCLASLAALYLEKYDNRMYFKALGEICREIIKEQPDAEQAVWSAVKNCKNGDNTLEGENILVAYGYGQSDFLPAEGRYGMLLAAVGAAAGGLLFLTALLFWHRKENARIKALEDYLEKINTGKSGVLFSSKEDKFSKLQDEIYKTVTMLYQTRDAALEAKNNFAQNLSNIAHQIKTPITAISLSLQMGKDNPSPEQLKQMEQQLLRLTRLEEALLLLSRIDAGTLPFEKKETDVYTVLMLAADNLQEMFAKADVAVHIPESGEAVIRADLEWTMEAMMNLFKNCMEHTPPGGDVYCSYEQNPLYTQILIWDTGNGFAEEDMPHLFERFFRGQRAKNGGIGIGLAIAKEIVERQNGVISARNRREGGACFEVRFYGCG